MNGAKPKRSRRGDGCCEPLPQSIGAKKGLGLGLRLSFLKLRSQSESEDCSEPLSQSQGNNIHLNQCKRQNTQRLAY
uniref:Uncharacterized protein n=1 Tax=Quercus lobata TaxID=97700 RepID=A0A7N2QY22_QUELO